MPWNKTLQDRAEALVDRLSGKGLQPPFGDIWRLEAEDRALIVRALECLIAINTPHK